jgi:hypothetical protein
VWGACLRWFFAAHSKRLDSSESICAVGTERVFRYPCLRELAKRLFCWNCDLASSSDKLCGRGLRWPKSGAWGAGFVLHFSGCGLMTLIEEMWCI